MKIRTQSGAVLYYELRLIVAIFGSMTIMWTVTAMWGNPGSFFAWLIWIAGIILCQSGLQSVWDKFWAPPRLVVLDVDTPLKAAPSPVAGELARQFAAALAANAQLANENAELRHECAVKAGEIEVLKTAVANLRRVKEG